jgi:glycosyltransferase involved in cell wall biosynthesis
VARSSAAEPGHDRAPSEAPSHVAGGGAGSHAATIGRPLKVAVVGVSQGRICGVRDHATLLAEALSGEDIACSCHWLYRGGESIRKSRTEFRAWAGELGAELHASEPDAIVWHYSVFSYAYRGFPVFVAPALAAMRAGGAPVITVLHEFVYPWRFGGVRGTGWALTQRALLMAVMRASAAVLVTAPFRADWLRSRAWLPRRPAVFAPVFSNLPAPSFELSEPDRTEGLIGLFGYAYEGAAASLVLDAMRLLDARELRVRLKLLGAPGPDSTAAGEWLAGARARGVAHMVSLSGVLSAQALSDALAGCDVLLHVEPSGPTSRKGTLAGSLASGSAVVAIDGPNRWAELTESGAAEVVQPTASALADAIAGLLGDEPRREALGARGGAFAREAMSVQRSAKVISELLDGLLG